MGAASYRSAAPGGTAAPLATPAPFGFVDADTAAAPLLSTFRSALTEPLPAGAEVSAEVKGRLTADGWDLGRFYYSVQQQTAGGFVARTLYWKWAQDAPDTDPWSGARWFDVTDDPYLRGLPADLAVQGGASVPAAVEVLRYVPLRRLTFRSGERIGKVKRASRLMPSYQRAAAVTEAASGSPLQLPRLLGADEEASVYYQERLTGRPFDTLVEAASVRDVFAAAGQAHAEFAALPAAHLPVETAAERAASVVAAIGWVASLRPEIAGDIALVTEALCRTCPPDDPRFLVTCHGDLVPSHLYATPAGTAVIDLDLAHRGDLHHDVAYFLAALPADVPLLAESGDPALRVSAERAYVDAYVAAARCPFDWKRYAWFRAAAEMHHFAVMHTKDRLRAGATDAMLQRAFALLDGLAGT